MKILITGTAGFIGFHLTKPLLDRGNIVVGLDSINDYYDIDLKYKRLEKSGFLSSDIKYNKLMSSSIYNNLFFIKLNLEDKENLEKLFVEHGFDYVIHLAAQAGVRYSLLQPQKYIDANITGFLNILECCRCFPVKHLTYASSSSVYGLNKKQPFSTKDNVDHPVSLYAASKKSNELMAHTYSHLFNIPTTGLRFFTVYGPWGRPDMALFIFTKSIVENKPIDVFNYGEMERDFTYISDIVDGVIRVNDHPPIKNENWNYDAQDPSNSSAPYRIYNIGNNNPIRLTDFITAIEDELGVKAIQNLLPIQPGDVTSTYADISDLQSELGYSPKVSVKEGIREFINWYREFYSL